MGAAVVDVGDDGGARRLSHQAAAQAELDAVAAVGVARMALTDAALAVLQAMTSIFTPRSTS